MKNLLESGVHFGHQTKRWDPRMRKFIFAERNGIHIIDLQKTIVCIKDAYEAVRRAVLQNKSVLFIGTKKQAQEAIKEQAERCGMFFVNNRWLGGMLTNFSTIKKSLLRLKKLEKMEIDGTFESLTKKEIAKINKEKAKLEKNLGGIKDMQELPGIIFIVDTRKETIAVAEACRMNIPIVAVVDTNANPEGITYPIPGNDDAIRAITLFTEIVANAVIEADNEAGLQVIETLGEEENLAKANASANTDTDDSKNTAPPSTATATEATAPPSTATTTEATAPPSTATATAEDAEPPSTATATEATAPPSTATATEATAPPSTATATEATAPPSTATATTTEATAPPSTATATEATAPPSTATATEAATPPSTATATEATAPPPTATATEATAPPSTATAKDAEPPSTATATAKDAAPPSTATAEDGFTTEDYSDYTPSDETESDVKKPRELEVVEEAGIDEDKLYEED